MVLIIVGDGGFIDRCYVNADRAGGRATLTIGNGVGDNHRTIEVVGGCEGEGAVRIDDDAAEGRVNRRSRDGERIAFGVAVIAQHRHCHRGVLGGGGDVRRGDRCVVNRGDVDRDCGSRGAALPITDRVRNDHGAGDVRCRREIQRAVGIDRHTTAGGVDGGTGDGKEVTIGVGVIAKDGHRDRGVFGRGGKVGLGDRAVIHSGDVDRHRCRGGAALAVADGVGDGVGAVEVGVGHIAQAAIGVDGDLTIDGGGADDCQDIIVGVAVVGEHVHDQGLVFRAGDVVVGGKRRRVGGLRGEGASREKVDSVSGGGVVVGDRSHLFQNPYQTDKVVSLVTNAAAGETGSRVFETFEGVFARAQGLDHPIRFGS